MKMKTQQVNAAGTKHGSRILALLLVLSMAIGLLSACGKKSEAAATDVTTAEETVTTEDTGTHTVLDTIDKEVVVPNTIDRIVIISTLPLASVYCMVTGEGKDIVGLTAASKNAAVHSFVAKIAPEIADAETGFASGENVNTEEVIKLNPDVVFYNTNAPADVTAAEKMTALGIPCVGFSTTVGGGDTIKTFQAWATLIGQVTGEEVRADEIVEYGKTMLDDVTARVAGVAAADKKSAVILGNYTQNAIMAAGSTFGKFWLGAIGAKSFTDDLGKPLAPINMEQLYAWNPDVIFLNSFSAFTAEQIMTSTAVEGHDFSGLKAVQDKRVYKIPLGVYYWFAPSSDSPLALLWLAKTLYPAQFEDVDMDQTVLEYYEKYYNLKLSEEDLKTLYNPPAESAMKQ